MFDSIFNIDLRRFIVLMLPLTKRRAQWVNWLMCLIKPSRDIYGDFVAYRDSTLYKLDHTPQVYSMENVLNDVYDRTSRRIYITDGQYVSAVRFYEPEETKPVHFYEEEPPVYFYEPGELENLDVDFVVVIPIALNLSEASIIRLRSLIDFYRLPDKTYTLRYE